MGTHEHTYMTLFTSIFTNTRYIITSVSTCITPKCYMLLDQNHKQQFTRRHYQCTRMIIAFSIYGRSYWCRLYVMSSSVNMVKMKYQKFQPRSQRRIIRVHISWKSSAQKLYYSLHHPMKYTRRCSDVSLNQSNSSNI